MTLYHLKATFERLGNDVVQWGWGLSGDAGDLANLGALVEEFQLSWGAEVDPTHFPADMKHTLFEVFEATGGPAVAVAKVEPNFAMGSGATWGPEEVAVCVSHHVDTVRGHAPRGATYFGPFADGIISGRRPPAALSDELVAFSIAWHGKLELAGFDPVVISKWANTVERLAPIGWPVIGYSTDDAWDTQRRRGVDPTTRTYVAV